MNEVVKWIIVLAFAGISSWLANRKGYNLWAWLLGGSLLSIIILLFLPNEKDMAEDKKDKLIARGNTIGWCLFVASFVWGFAEGFFKSS